MHDLIAFMTGPAIEGPGEPITYAVPVEQVRPGDVVTTTDGPVLITDTGTATALGPWLMGKCANTGTPRTLRTISGELADVIRHL